MLLSFGINPSVTAKVMASPRAAFILYCFTLSGTELVTCVQVCPCPGWVQFEMLQREPLRNAEAAVAVIKSLGGSPANAAFSNGFDDCMLFFQPD